ncbi:hypothetical protein [Fulvivirga lutimaris]|uniref:hypothetical protein n=1 Tax=Fulvivirga lutimaris TaxID=1819566 RepID=UPI0012BCF882|nr:hypothetical protein [Fulvivirga lutimaris]MTI39108.1 hypothetical protein [Fulvivirga lutimaris]
MSDLNFLKSFLTEDLYIIKENQKETAPYTQAEEKAPQKEYQEKESTEESSIINEPVEEIKTKPFPPHKGSFNKKIFIAVQDNDNEFINDSELEFLLKILGAVKLSLDDVAIINAAKSKIELTDLMVWSATHYLSFTAEPISQHNSQFYTPFQEDTVQCLSCDKLKEIAADKGKKQQLWTALQQLFLK